MTTHHTKIQKRAVLGIVATTEEAEHVVTELKRQGFLDDDISVLLPDKKGTRDFAHVQHTKAPEGAVAGGSVGGVLGGALGLLAGIGALAIPGLGPFIAAGPIMAALSVAAAGAAVGGVTGALIGFGVPEIEAKNYEGKVKGGNILLAVHVENADERTSVKNILLYCAATHVVVVDEAPVPKRAQVSPSL